MKLRLLIALAILAVCAPGALAADYDFTLSAATANHEWEGAPEVTRGSPVFDPAARTAIPCDSGPARPCELVLIKVTEAGKFIAAVEGMEGAGGTTDVDLYLYKSDESGAQGEELASTAAIGDETLAFNKAAPGFYLLVVDYYIAFGAGYKGKLKFTPSAPAAAPAPPTVGDPPAPPAPPASSPQPKTSKKAACQKKAKKIKNKKKRAKALKKCKKMKG